MPMRFATAPVSWGVMEVETWERRTGCGEVLDEMVRAGYEGTELGPWGFLPTDPEALKQELDRRGLALVGAFVPMALACPECHDAALEAVEQTARLLAAASAGVIVLADAMDAGRMAVAGSATASHAMPDEQWPAAMRLVEQAAWIASDSGLRAVFHHHAGTFVETPAEVERLMHASSVGLCLDTGHYYYGGGDPVRAARRWRDRIWHLHLKDVRPSVLADVRARKIGYMEAVSRGVFCPLGEGGVDLPGVLRELANFNGWAVYEQDVDPSRDPAPPVESAARSREYLRALLTSPDRRLPSTP